MRHRTAFAAAIAMFSAISAAIAIPDVAARHDALNKIGPYKSRGKGGKRPRHPSKRFVATDKRDARKARNRRSR